ncbi:hypothetical protein [Paenibacillus graminis]|uniref:hypothetical protein n=1 Tax=Paenibacillus graminis TaxID=189425 RepID=UPI002DB9DADF|nr:hypothetical protein [Paenibacillus graminis]MEC0167281.1 hypothetical protein [Paenibacillus graminis]
MVAELVRQQEHFISGVLRHAGEAPEGLGHRMDRQAELGGEVLQRYFFTDGHKAGHSYK